MTSAGMIDMLEAGRKESMMKNKKLDGTALGIAAGLLWGFGVFFLTWWVMLFDGVTHDVTFLGHLYRGYNISPAGQLYRSVVGAGRRRDWRDDLCPVVQPIRRTP